MPWIWEVFNRELGKMHPLSETLQSRLHHKQLSTVLTAEISAVWNKRRRITVYVSQNDGFKLTSKHVFNLRTAYQNIHALLHGTSYQVFLR